LKKGFFGLIFWVASGGKKDKMKGIMNKRDLINGNRTMVLKEECA